MTALLITSFVILLSYILYAGVAESLSATYYKVKKPYLFQIALGMTGFLRLFSAQWKDIPFVLNHLGLLIALTGAVLGSADIQQLEMNTLVGRPQWMATNERGDVLELPLAIELHEFSIEEFMNVESAESSDIAKVTADLEDLTISIINSRKCGVRSVIYFHIAISEYCANDGQGNVLGAYAPDGLSGEVNGNYAGHFDIIGLVEKLFYQLRPALANAHGAKSPVAGVAVRAKNHFTASGVHLAHVLVNNAQMGR